MIDGNYPGKPDLIHTPDGETAYVDTQLRPYDTGVDLTDVPETGAAKLARPVPHITVHDSVISAGTLRELLGTQYPNSDFPDIARLLEKGLLLYRMFSAEKVQQALQTGSDRSSNAHIDHNGGVDGEGEIVRANNLQIGRTTYLGRLPVDFRDFVGTDTLNLNGVFGRALAIYDPRYVLKAGSASNGFSVFPDDPRKALLGVVEFVPQGNESLPAFS